MRAHLKEIIKIGIIAYLIAIPLKYYVFQTFKVQGASMEGSIEDRDRLLIEEVSYRFGNPARGDIIVFKYPNDTTQFFVKRVIGLPGETVEIKNNKVTIVNATHPKGFLLNESDYLTVGQETVGNLRIPLAGDEYFVMGDNRLHSSDSRSWGAVNRSLITGRVMSRAWPINKANIFHTLNYGF